MYISYTLEYIYGMNTDQKVRTLVLVCEVTGLIPWVANKIFS